MALDLSATDSAAAVIDVSVDGQPASIGYDHEFLYVVRGHHKQAGTPASKAHVRVPLALVLNASFVSDSDGGSLLVRLLSPPVQAQSSNALGAWSFFKKVKSAPECMVSLSPHAYGALTPAARAERLKEQLEGPCSSLRLVKIEARVVATRDGADIEARTQAWVDQVMNKAYKDIKPYRRVKVLINPVGGPGKGRQLFESRARPILEAAGCKLDITITTHRMHGLEIARDLEVENYDAVGVVSGDGLLHEMLNGFATRPDADKALALPLAPIPAGSGNAMSINLLGAQQGFSLALACLNIIKGRPMKLDLLSVTQPASAFPPGVPVPGRPDSSTLSKRAAKPRRDGTLAGSATGCARESEDIARLIDAPSKPYVQYYSFLSQAIGIFADLDLGTEHLRALGDTRFVIGYATSVMRNAKCEVDVDIKLGTRGSKNKAEMRQRVIDFDKCSQSSAISASESVAAPTVLGSDIEEQQQGVAASSPRAFVHGVITDPLTTDGNPPPPFDMLDPSWQSSFLTQTNSARQVGAAMESSQERDQAIASGWMRIYDPLASLYAGKLPFVSRDLMQFPFALPNDGTIDVAMILHAGGRAAKVPENGYAESGQLVYQKAITYLKVEAIRVTPRRKQGDKTLKNGGLISIDGEKVPYAAFQVEIAQGLQYSVLSLYGRFCVAVVEPPSAT
ncbi:related to LCB5 - sphingolipid long chain base kinase [Melanopsichium pennsylvanicum]|uniref:Related to LCB5 - sphingolipid long chain base kinase n=2 Tax=Melanopsichium pennsylvanicum TaxID=63383 RepID=A0AAJ4XTQ1_9BASI|nr:related to LCB5-sphingolipid long chain base kinase [Melanopsichium pennsylvanicum 4]SNX87852.1 related to LCB5 - sphingolipid long chain base kinase [Melanopsichium pennsylvanicum]